MTPTFARRAAAAAIAVATLLLPTGAVAQSAAPSAAPSPAPSGATGMPSDAWAVAVCTARDRIGGTPDVLAALGQSALAGDADGVALAAITAGLAGDQALQALDGLPESWTPGAAFSGYLSAMGFALVDMGVALAETDLTDADSLRTALGNSIAAYDAWAHVQEEERTLQDATGFDCAGVPVPSPAPYASPEPATPEPTFVGDTELLSRFPTEIAGEPVEPASRTGAELLATSNPSDEKSQVSLQQLTDFLAAAGFGIEDVSLGFAYVPTEDGIGASITAFRVKGGDAATLLPGLIPLVTIDYTDLVQETVTVDGRELIRVSDGPYDPAGIYEVLVPSGDTIWAISAADPVLTEIVKDFPG